MLDYRMTRAWQSAEIRQDYDTRDSMLYALGIGLGRDPVDERQLCFVYEKDLAAFPTLACVLASPGFWMRDQKELGIDATKVVHGEQSVVMHSALAPAGTIVGVSRVTRVVDKGEGKGAVVHVEKELRNTDGLLVATVEMVLFCRNDGGFSAGGGVADLPAPPNAPLPSRAPDRISNWPVRADAALLYRLSGDTNPLHADPAMAARVGFQRPILHGLASFGMAAQRLMAEWRNLDVRGLRSIRARLSAPVYPGETLRIDSWELPQGLAFQVRVMERDVVALANGLVEFSDAVA